MSATPPVAVWITRWTTPLVVLAPSGVTLATPPVAEWTTTTATPPTAPRRTTAAGPAIPLCFATGDGGACGSRSAIQPAHRFAPSNTPCQFERPRRSERARPPATPACHAGCFRSFHIERATASRPRTQAEKPTPAEPRTSRTRSVRSAFVGSGGSVGLLRSIASAFRCRCSGGGPAVVPRRFVLVSRGGAVGLALARSQRLVALASHPVAHRPKQAYKPNHLS
jgi:hypothetical protein